MKNFIIILLLFGLIACNQNDSQSNTTNTTVVANLDWMLGNWQRTNDKEGQVTFEHWQKISTQEYKGLGFTLQDKDTVFKENMRLIPINGIWNLEVSAVNENPTLFYFTKQTENNFICENPNNEFPKIIEYSFFNKKLKARVSTEEMKIDFEFKKIK